ncbi:hypothetical protein NIASO_13290 [Niabella soli DSM 19437]|uniref:Uncharacterized protein n=1 Tax=Niabella soli DSM 19437 TaxID=929713 RepID=W0F8G1_9BACT|nr:hypothetical protein NIASO_13290 [Niabella soli DSM 19437]
MNSLVAFAAFRLWRSVGKRRGASSATVEECDATKFHSSTAAGRVIIATAQFQAAMPVFPVRKNKKGRRRRCAFDHLSNKQNFA